MFGHHDDDKDNQPDQPGPVVTDEPSAVVSQDDSQAPDADQAPTTTPPEPVHPVDDVTPPPGYQPPTEPANDMPSAPADDAPEADDLAGVRQQALSDLSPLIGHLEHQTPEEKFQVTMMMIQANDDRSLIPTAYETAKLIADDKARAQALLDIVQEINYFTLPKG